MPCGATWYCSVLFILLQSIGKDFVKRLEILANLCYNENYST